MDQPFRALGADHHTALTRLNPAAAPHTVLAHPMPQPPSSCSQNTTSNVALYVFDVLPEPVFPDGGCVCEVGH